MKICVRYCGGCNSSYDRKKLVESIIDTLPSHVIWEYTIPPQDTDVILHVAGCSRKCNSIPLSNAMKLIVVESLESGVDVKRRLIEEVQGEL